MVFHSNGGEEIKPENGKMLKLLAEKKKSWNFCQIGDRRTFIKGQSRRVQAKSDYKNSVQSKMKMAISGPNIYVLRLVSGLCTQRTDI